jgi:hypothetical protein
MGQVLCWRDKHSRVFAAMFFLGLLAGGQCPGVAGRTGSAGPFCAARRAAVPRALACTCGGPTAARRPRNGPGGPLWRVRVQPHQVGHPGEVLHGGRLDDQLATCPRVEERGLDDGTRLDPEEVGDLSDDGGRGDDRTAEPPEQRGARLWCLSLALSIATSGLVSAISIGTLRELLMLDVLRALGQVRRDLSRGSRSWPPHSQVRLQRADECWIVVFLEDDRRRVQHVRRGGSHQLNHAG